jgi:hypothetical protein
MTLPWTDLVCQWPEHEPHFAGNLPHRPISKAKDLHGQGIGGGGDTSKMEALNTSAVLHTFSRRDNREWDLQGA